MVRHFAPSANSSPVSSAALSLESLVIIMWEWLQSKGVCSYIPLVKFPPSCMRSSWQFCSSCDDVTTIQDLQPHNLHSAHNITAVSFASHLCYLKEAQREEGGGRALSLLHWTRPCNKSMYLEWKFLFPDSVLCGPTAIRSLFTHPMALRTVPPA